MNNTAQSNNNGVILAVIVAIAIAIGGYLYYKETQTETVSMNIGGKELSATFEE